MLHCKMNQPSYLGQAMSKQLSIAAAFSVLAMALFALNHGANSAIGHSGTLTGAPIEIEAPALLNL